MTISVGEDGEVHMSMGPIHVSREMSPVWLEPAVAHLATARVAHEDVLATLKVGDDEQLAEAMDREFRASMQAIVASATAMDALYASAKDCINLPESLTARWREKGTARWKQVAEVLRRAFRVKPGEGARNLRQALKELYHYRDMAVHPSSAAAQVVLHPDLGQGTDWRFVTFSYSNALQLVWVGVGFTHSLISHLDGRETEKTKSLADGLKVALDGLFVLWEAEYGPVEHNPTAPSA